MSTLVEMPRYKCHKEVWALKINALEPIDGNVYRLFFEDSHIFDHLVVDSAYVEKHQPQAGGYYVVYQDGYASYSPAEAFESGYTRVD